MSKDKQQDIIADSTGPTLPKEIVIQAENMSLKLQNVQLQLQLMHQQLGQAMDTRNKLHKEMEALRQKVMMEYGLDLAKVTIANDGTVEAVPSDTGPG